MTKLIWNYGDEEFSRFKEIAFKDGTTTTHAWCPSVDRVKEMCKKHGVDFEEFRQTARQIVFGTDLLLIDVPVYNAYNDGRREGAKTGAPMNETSRRVLEGALARTNRQLADTTETIDRAKERLGRLKDDRKALRSEREQLMRDLGLGR